ncbi:diguanylate cyclase [Massilia sp. Root418]|jgi:diguanylate cyclase (GGDEF)-like protein/PAS domain S-box-containing protein|uniref:sensor domain-containing protein n=1 Tax=Massilia sp. Root418 TaxID=1736532 RepID=UPI0006F1D450|nr:GGDEF domain-containing protein [Massilia sp. Root418]KQW87784.1 diguanylate cyclase [Massilia sp. Root418]
MNPLVSAPVASFADLLLDAICMVDTSGRFVFVSAACERIFGYRPDEMVGLAMIDLVYPADRERTLAAARAIMDGQPNMRFENRYVRKDGSIVHIMWSARWSEADQLRIAVARDITASKQAEAMQAALYAISESAHAAEDLPALYQRMHDIIASLLPVQSFAVVLRDAPGEPLYFAYHADASGPESDAQLAVLLCEEALRRNLPLRVAPDTLSALPPALMAAARPHEECWMGVPLNTPQGTIGALVLRDASSAGCGAGYTDQHQDLLSYVSTQVATAIQRKQLQSRLHFLAEHDELTHLPNRRLFHDRLHTAIARAQRHQDSLSLLFIDLNKFKQVNDLHGHTAGDQLLQVVARRIKDCVREADTVARLGGDEFVVVLEEAARHEAATLVREKIHQALAVPVHMGDGRTLQTSASIGIARFPEDGADMQQLLRHADQAMYAAKQQPGEAVA